MDPSFKDGRQSTASSHSTFVASSPHFTVFPEASSLLMGASFASIGSKGSLGGLDPKIFASFAGSVEAVEDEWVVVVVVAVVVVVVVVVVLVVTVVVVVVLLVVEVAIVVVYTMIAAGYDPLEKGDRPYNLQYVARLLNMLSTSLLISMPDLKYPESSQPAMVREENGPCMNTVWSL